MLLPRLAVRAKWTVLGNSPTRRGSSDPFEGESETVAGRRAIWPLLDLCGFANQRGAGVEKLYAITTMTPDAGFSDLVEAGVAEALEPDELAVLNGSD